MKKEKYITKMYKIRLAKDETDLFGVPVVSEQWDALCKAVLDDFHHEKFQFTHPQDNETKYVRHYVLPCCYGFAVINVGLFRNSNDYGTVAINIMSENYEPYVVLADYTPAFANHEVLADIVSRALNWVMRVKGVNVILEPWEVKAGEKKVMWKRDCVDTYMVRRKFQADNIMTVFGHEQLKKSHTKRKPINFRSYIKSGMEDKVLSWLHSEIDDLDQPIDMMRPMRALYEQKKRFFQKKPTVVAFIAEFHKEGLIKKSSYNKYMDTRIDVYYGDDSFDETKNRMNAKFGIAI